MSAPTTDTTTPDATTPEQTWTQPVFTPGGETVPEPMPGEPTDGTTVATTDQPATHASKFARRSLYVAIATLVFSILSLVFVLLVNYGLPSPHASRSHATPSTSSCPTGQVEVDQNIPGDNYQACITQAWHDKLQNKAAKQYNAELARGEVIYDHWLSAHKLAPKSDNAITATAQRYICKLDNDFRDDTLYAATLADLPVSPMEFAVEGYRVTIPGFDPQDQLCRDGKPIKLQPKDPSQDPAAQGKLPSGAGINNGPIDGPQ